MNFKKIARIWDEWFAGPAILIFVFGMWSLPVILIAPSCDREAAQQAQLIRDNKEWRANKCQEMCKERGGVAFVRRFRGEISFIGEYRTWSECTCNDWSVIEMP